MRKPHGGVYMLVEYAKHLRAGTKSGKKTGGMKREYWKQYRALEHGVVRADVQEWYEEETGAAEDEPVFDAATDGSDTGAAEDDKPSGELESETPS